MTGATDWDKYYRNTPQYTSVTRAISARKIIGLIQKHTTEQPISICEIGGANSCFVDSICDSIFVSDYHVVDFNEYGLGLLSRKQVSAQLTAEKADVLLPYVAKKQFDLVYSVGLIEHFDGEGTRKAIEGHFDRCKSGGVVMVTFPTPTLPYRIIRRGAEVTRKWAFPDERPLAAEEVIATCRDRGSVIHQSINWMIGLTQGYVLTRKR